MNLQATLLLMLRAGGPGSGRKPGFHGTTEQSARSILKQGFRPDAYVSLSKEAAQDYALEKIGRGAKEGKTFVVLTVGDVDKAGFTQSEHASLHLHAKDKVGSEHVSRAERYQITKVDKTGTPHFKKVADLK